MPSIEDTFRSRTPESAARAQRASAVMPGGDTRVAGHHPPYQLTMARGAGPHLHDVDGHRYLDLIGNFTSLVHGNAFAPIQEAAAAAAAGGTAWPAVNDHVIALAEELVGRVSSVELVRFTNSGSEATSLAVEIARAATGRRKFVMARGGYHGSMPEFEPAAGERADSDTLLATFGDLASWEAVLDHHGDDVACVIIEPVMGAGGVVTPPIGFLAGLVEAAHRVGALGVFDEVMTLRLAPGGRQEHEGVRPDLTAMAKIIGGGYPVGAVGGRAALMELCNPFAPRLFHSGTFNGNPVTAAAGLASIRHLSSDAIADMDRRTERLDAGLARSAAAHGVPLSSRRAGSLLQLYLSDTTPVFGPVRTDADLVNRFHLAALNAGVFAASRGLIALSTVVDDAVVDEAIDRLDSAFAALAETR